MSNHETVLNGGICSHFDRDTVASLCEALSEARVFLRAFGDRGTETQQECARKALQKVIRGREAYEAMIDGHNLAPAANSLEVVA